MLDTTRRVATPEGIELTLRLAGPVPRALAWSIDFLLRGALVFIVGMLARPLLGKAGWGVILIVAFFVEWLLPAWFETFSECQTPGKRLLGLVVLHADGTPVGWPGALIRNLLRAVDFLPFLYGVRLARMLVNRDFKRLGDLAAGTVVGYQREKRRSGAGAIPQAPPLPPPNRSQLDEQRAVLDLAERAAPCARARFEELAELPTPWWAARAAITRPPCPGCCQSRTTFSGTAG